MISLAVGAPSRRAHCLRVPTNAERAAELARFERLAEADQLRALLRSLAECFAWCLIGLFFIAWAVHTPDPGWGRIAFFGGLVIGNAGMLFSLCTAALRAEERGDWTF